MKVELNGYHTDQSIGKKAKTLKSYLYLSLGLRNAVDKFKKEILYIAQYSDRFRESVDFGKDMNDCRQLPTPVLFPQYRQTAPAQRLPCLFLFA